MNKGKMVKFKSIKEKKNENGEHVNKADIVKDVMLKKVDIMKDVMMGKEKILLYPYHVCNPDICISYVNRQSNS